MLKNDESLPNIFARLRGISREAPERLPQVPTYVSGLSKPLPLLRSPKTNYSIVVGDATTSLKEIRNSLIEVLSTQEKSTPHDQFKSYSFRLTNNNEVIHLGKADLIWMKGSRVYGKLKIASMGNKEFQVFGVNQVEGKSHIGVWDGDVLIDFVVLKKRLTQEEIHWEGSGKLGVKYLFSRTRKQDALEFAGVPFRHWIEEGKKSLLYEFLPNKKDDTCRAVWVNLGLKENPKKYRRLCKQIVHLSYLDHKSKPAEAYLIERGNNTACGVAVYADKVVNVSFNDPQVKQMPLGIRREIFTKQHFDFVFPSMIESLEGAKVKVRATGGVKAQVIEKP